VEKTIRTKKRQRRFDSICATGCNLRAIAVFLSLAFVMASIGARSAPGDSATVTFARDVAPIIFQRCAGCHRPGQAAPFSLLTYEDLKKRAKLIDEVVGKRYMPPWLPEDGPHRFLDDRRLNVEEIRIIQTWIKQGTEEGSAAQLPPFPKWTEGWKLGKPDLVVQLPEPYTLAAEGKDVYRNFVFSIPTSERKFVRGVEFLPGNAKVIHHAFINVDPTPVSRRRALKENPPGFDGMMLPETAIMPGGQFLGWQPGKNPYFSPDGLGWVLQTNTDLVLQLHMHPSGKPETVQPSIGFFFTTQPPTNSAFRINLNPLIIDIPAGKSDYTIEDSYKLPIDVTLLGISPHAHYLGKHLEGRATFPDGRVEELLDIPNWDFNWQGDYRYSAPVFLPRDTTLSMRFTFDNSSDNPRNPGNPPKRVKYGLQTTDEMGELWFVVLPRSARERAALGQDFYKHLAQRTIDYNEYVLKENPKDAEAHTRAGRARLFLGDVQAAMQHYHAAVAANPEYDRGWYELGFAYLHQNQPGEAKKAFEKVVMLNPDDYEARGSLGTIYMQQGNLQQAERFFREALSINPSDRVARGNLEALQKARQKQ
jgi:hypothetical protein